MPSHARLLALPTLLALALGPAAPARAELPPLVSRDLLFGNPERTSPDLSPDARRLAWLAPDEKGVMQVWVKSTDKEDAKSVTADKKRGIRRYLWAEDDRTLLYLQDADGDENFHVFGVDLESGNVRDYTPFQGVRAAIARVSPKMRDRFLVTLNLRDRRLFDVHSVDLRSGAVALDTENPGDVIGWNATDDLVVRGATAATPDGGKEIRVRDGAKAPWRSLLKAGPEDALTFGLLDFTADGRRAILLSSIGADTARVVEKDLALGGERVVAEDPRADAGDVVIHPSKHVVQAVDFPAGRQSWTVVDPTVIADFQGLSRLFPGDFEIVSRDREDKTWLVAFHQDAGPVRFYRWDRATRSASFLFAHRPRLEGLALSGMSPVVIPSRDGLELNGYLTLPRGVPPQNLPLVLYVHGGPWGRDQWGFDPVVQMLANRGYAVLQVNFRASTGYGKRFLNAGNREWGKKMQDDLTDAVTWAVRQGTADPKRVAILGGSYGGYASLAGAAFTPDVYRCAVPIVGPSSLFTLLRSIPPYWKPMQTMMYQRIGNPEDPADEKLLRDASPLYSADKIRIPLLVGQGANDPRVKQAESEQIVAAIEKGGGRAVYVLYPDEGHGFQRPENRVDFFARTDAFLAECLGGRFEPLAGERIPGSTAVVKVVGKK